MPLPPQTKALLSVDFTAVEEINYQHIFEQMLDDCGLTPTGAPIRQNWVLNDRITDKMKKWLGNPSNTLMSSKQIVRLRQACSHPAVGTWKSGAKEMRTMDEVLDKMFEETSTAINHDERELFIAKIKRGQIYDHKGEHVKALEQWECVLKDIVQRIKLKQTDILDLKSFMNSEAVSDTSITSDDENVEDERQTKKLQHLRTKRANELRDLLDLQHRATFMMASTHFQLKNEAEETRLYDEAETLRREVLLCVA